MTAIRVRATWTLPAPSAVLTARQLLTREEITRGLSCSEKNRDYCTAIQPDWGARATCSSAASASRSRRRSASSVSCSAATCARGRARCALSEPACKIAAKTQADAAPGAAMRVARAAEFRFGARFHFRAQHGRRYGTRRGTPTALGPEFFFFLLPFLSRTWPTWSLSMSTWIFCAGESRYLPAGPWAAPAGLARRARPQKAGGNSRTQAYGATWDSGLSQSCGGWIKKSAAVGRGGRFGGRHRATPAGGVDQLG